MKLRLLALGAVTAVLVGLDSNAQAQGKSLERGHLKGKEAIAALADRLPEVALAHRMSADRLKEIFETDEALNIDKNDNLLYVEKMVSAEEGTTPGSESIDGTIPLANALLLHSKPGSAKTIHIDFDGAVVTGTAWNDSLGQSTWNAPAYDTDGSPSTFNDSERALIIGVWRRVAEDFAPFDVDVTTQQPPSGFKGTTALVTANPGLCSCGGIAYLGVFSSTSNSLKPALVFMNNLQYNEKYIAEATSHEVGHNLGLNHDGYSGGSYYQGHGSSETGWAPIMGNGYYRELTQWSKGEYSGANNTEDDLSKIVAGGAPLRADDYGNTINTAAPIDQGSTFGISGIISNRTDVDFFVFNAGAGEISIEAIPAAVGPDLDIQLTVYDAAGKVIGSANPESTSKASLSFSAPADGIYYISVDGIGYGTGSTGYSDYASLGRYTILGSRTDPTGNQSPTAIISASATTGLAPAMITFDGSASGDTDGSISSYTWNFGDGTTAQGAVVQHTYPVAGTFPVTLTVRDNGGLSDADSISITLTGAQNQPPVADFSAPDSATAPATVYFNGNGSRDADGTISSYEWDMGDGGKFTGAAFYYTFLNPGTYTVTLKVTDNSGGTATMSKPITILENSNYVAAPSGLTASLSGSLVTLRWTDRSTNEDGFRVLRRTITKTGNGKNAVTTYSAWVNVATTSSNQTSATNQVTLDGTTVEYQVAAFRASGATGLSNSATLNLGGRRK